MIRLRYILRKQDSLGGSRTQVSVFEGVNIIIGRGGSSQILLESSLVSLEHLWISLDKDVLHIKDLGSYSGTRVNGRKIASGDIVAGDVLQLGDIQLLVEKDDESWAIVLEKSKEEQKVSESLPELMRRIETSAHLPSIRILSLLVIVLVLCFAYVLPAGRDNLMAWVTGPMSTQHQMLQQNCTECHQEMFSPVKESACVACHSLTEHIPLGTDLVDNLPQEKKSSLSGGNCTDCHREHEGSAGLTLTENTLCTECHQSIDKIADLPAVQNVKDFASHPQFAVSVLEDPDDNSSGEHIYLDDTAHLRDTARMKLNHEVHLRPDLRGPTGPTTLRCSNCHALRDDKSTMLPVSFDKNCRSCHGLGYDERIGSKEVPHASANIVYNFLYAEYAKLALEKENQTTPTRLLPGKSETRDEDAVALAERSIARESRLSEFQIFEKTGCVLCHEIRKRPESEVSDATLESRYLVLQPKVPRVWMPAAKFNHGAHTSLRCESCHGQVAQSTQTSDVLLPKIRVCQNCHVDPGKTDKVGSNCLMCHSYHDSLRLPDERKRQIEEIFHRTPPSAREMMRYIRRMHERGGS